MNEEVYRQILERLKVESPPTVAPTSPDWLSVFRHLADLTAGITRHDPKFPLILDLLKQCDEAYKAGDAAGLLRLVKAIRQTMGTRLEPGDRICWKGADGFTHGPAVIQEITELDHRRWAWVEWDGGRWISESITVTRKEPTDG